MHVGQVLLHRRWALVGLGTQVAVVRVEEVVHSVLVARQLRAAAEHGWAPIALQVPNSKMPPHVLRYVGPHPERVAAHVTHVWPLPCVGCAGVIL